MKITYTGGQRWDWTCTCHSYHRILLYLWNIILASALAFCTCIKWILCTQHQMDIIIFEEYNTCTMDNLWTSNIFIMDYSYILMWTFSQMTCDLNTLRTTFSWWINIVYIVPRTWTWLMLLSFVTISYVMSVARKCLG